MNLRKVCLALALVVPSVCAADKNEADLGDAFRLQQKCWREWDGLVDAWLEQGGFSESIQQTRSRIAQDRKSTFAAFVRAVWAQQQRTNSEPFGAWPISDDAFRAVSFAALVASPEYVRSKDCQNPVWLDGAFWDALRNRGTQAKRLSDMPPEVDTSDAHQVSIWTEYWLFVRRDE
jgi:hypothetical protein